MSRNTNALDALAESFMEQAAIAASEAGGLTWEEADLWWDKISDALLMGLDSARVDS